MSSPAGVGRNLAGLGRDILSLVELQFRLLQFDLRESGANARVPLVLIAFGAVLALGTIPVLLLAGGWALISLADFSPYLAFAVVGTGGIVIAAAMVWGGARLLSRAVTPLQRSQQEFQDNVRWIKQALRRRAGAESDEAAEDPVPSGSFDQRGE